MMGCSFPSSCSCSNTAPRPMPDASVSKTKGFLQVHKCQYWCCHALLFQSFECLQYSRHQGDRVVLQLAVLTTGKIVQWSGNMGEVLDETKEVPYSPNKLPDSSNGGGGVPYWRSSGCLLGLVAYPWQKFRVLSR